jgi:cytochrome b-561
MVYKAFPTLKHDTAKLIHLILHGIALVLGALGIYFAFKNHNESEIANLYSLHSWIGIGTITLYGIQLIYLHMLANLDSFCDYELISYFPHYEFTDIFY